VIEAEIRWIAHGRKQGWRLTNLTEGGEGSARKTARVDAPQIVRSYLDGESELALAKNLGVSRDVIRRRLLEAGVAIRGVSAANVIRMRRMSLDARRALSSKARKKRSARARAGALMCTCSACGVVGHNRRTCSTLGAI
jgi:hypothetical protein